MSSPLLLGLALVVACGLGVILLELLIGRPEVAAALVLGSSVLQAVYEENVPSLVLPGQTRVGITDVVSALILAAAVARLLRLRRLDRFHLWLVLLAVVLFVSLIRGVAAFGPQQSIADFRQYLFFVGVALYFATFPPSVGMCNRIGQIWLAMTIPMMALVCLRWLAIFAGIDLGVPAAQYGADSTIRVIDGPYTFFLASAFMLTIPAWLRGERAGWMRSMSIVLLLFVLVLNRRTVWLAILIGVAVIGLRDRRLGRRAIVLITLGGIVTAIAFVYLGALQEGPQPLIKTDSGNLDWRIQGWSELISAWSHNLLDWAVGQPFGSGFTREIKGIATSSHPHNFYIETMIRAGLAGLLALIALTVGLLRALWHTPTRGTELLGPAVVSALLAMQIVWSLTWVPGSEQGIVTGIACALAAAQKWSRKEVERPMPLNGGMNYRRFRSRPT
jgi:hypothetical protein